MYYYEVNTKEIMSEKQAAFHTQDAAESVGCPHCSSNHVKAEKIGEVLLGELNVKCLDCENRFEVAAFEFLTDDEMLDKHGKYHNSLDCACSILLL